MNKSIMVVVLAVLLCCCSVSSAALTIFHSEADFLSAAGPLSFEGFEGLPANNSLGLGSITTPGFVVTAPNNRLGIYNVPIGGAQATEGARFLAHQSGANVTTTFTFNPGIRAFGFDLLDYGDFGTGQLTITNDIGDSTVVAVAGGADGNVQYFGMISGSPFVSAILTNTISGEGFGVDRVSYGVPEPATLSLLALSGLLIARRRWAGGAAAARRP